MSYGFSELGLTRIRQVKIPVSDLRRSVAWYRKAPPALSRPRRRPAPAPRACRRSPSRTWTAAPAIAPCRLRPSGAAPGSQGGDLVDGQPMLAAEGVGVGIQLGGKGRFGGQPRDEVAQGAGAHGDLLPESGDQAVDGARTTWTCAEPALERASAARSPRHVSVVTSSDYSRPAVRSSCDAAATLVSSICWAFRVNPRRTACERPGMSGVERKFEAWPERRNSWTGRWHYRPDRSCPPP
jgi:hypothetical protein